MQIKYEGLSNSRNCKKILLLPLKQTSDDSFLRKKRASFLFCMCYLLCVSRKRGKEYNWGCSKTVVLIVLENSLLCLNGQLVLACLMTKKYDGSMDMALAWLSGCFQCPGSYVTFRKKSGNPETTNSERSKIAYIAKKLIYTAY